MFVFISPHFDDAIGSCGGIIRRLATMGRSVKIITIMACIRGAKLSHVFYVWHRRLENRRACRTIGAQGLDAPFLDGRYRRDDAGRSIYKKKSAMFGNENREPELIVKIRDYIMKNTTIDDILVVPAGLGNHIDHRLVRAATEDTGRKVVFYEEFYYDKKSGARMPGYHTVFLNADEIDMKIRAMDKYTMTLRRLFHKNWRSRMREYFLKFRAIDGRSFETFSDASIFPSSPRIIVSFTSFPAPGRLENAHLVINSILRQTVRPDKIVLYLAAPEFPDKKLPIALVKCIKENPIAEIRWVPHNIRSYKKLVPALCDFPDDLIITVDDDLVQNSQLIEKLLWSYRKYPRSVSGCRVCRISKSCDGMIKKYKKWRFFKKKRVILYGCKPRFRNVATTGGGALFPPRVLHPDVTCMESFTDIAPTGDDLWFWAMAVRNNVGTAVAHQFLELDVIENSQQQRLASVNNNKMNSQNDRTVKKLLAKYPEIRERLKVKDSK